MVFKADKIAYQETDSVLEALILEASLIKKHQPKYNTKEKDNKSFNYVCITKEDKDTKDTSYGAGLPKVLVVRGRNILKDVTSNAYQASYGPFPNGSQLKEAMKIIRRIFPYIDSQSSKKDNFEFYRQLGLVPNMKDETTLSLAHLEYLKNIVNLKLFFQGKKKKIIQNMKKDMMSLAKKKEFEKAGEVKKRIFALEHINDVALIKGDKESKDIDSKSFRIEAYDVAHMSGANIVGVMTVVQDGESLKSEYKKFIIKTQKGSNDTGSLEEILSRRFRHVEWGLPSLVVVDGSTAQINVAKRVLDFYQLKIPIVSVVKDDRHKAKAIIGDEKIIKNYKKDILLANSESHRFAIVYHKQKRNSNFLK
jgi:excinuclease UvrABC nuclease subunit